MAWTLKASAQGGGGGGAGGSLFVCSKIIHIHLQANIATRTLRDSCYLIFAHSKCQNLQVKEPASIIIN